MRTHVSERANRARRRLTASASWTRATSRSRRRFRRHLDPTILALAIVVTATEHAAANAAASGGAWNPDEVAVARHCVSERSFAESDDCRVIAWIDHRNAKRRGLAVREWMARAHSRHLRSASRPWIAELDGAGNKPASWPARYPWERARDVWFRTLGVVRSVLSGGSHGCDGTPLVWGSPRYDRMRLASWYARGYAHLRCGDTRNEIVGVRR